MSQVPKSWVARNSGTAAVASAARRRPGRIRSWTLPWRTNRQVVPAKYWSANSRAQAGNQSGTATAAFARQHAGRLRPRARTRSGPAWPRIGLPAADLEMAMRRPTTRLASSVRSRAAARASWSPARAPWSTGVPGRLGRGQAHAPSRTPRSASSAIVFSTAISRLMSSTPSPERSAATRTRPRFRSIWSWMICSAWPKSVVTLKWNWVASCDISASARLIFSSASYLVILCLTSSSFWTACLILSRLFCTPARGGRAASRSRPGRPWPASGRGRTWRRSRGRPRCR